MSARYTGAFITSNSGRRHPISSSAPSSLLLIRSTTSHIHTLRTIIGRSPPHLPHDRILDQVPPPREQVSPLQTPACNLHKSWARATHTTVSAGGRAFSLQDSRHLCISGSLTHQDRVRAWTPLSLSLEKVSTPWARLRENHGGYMGTFGGGGTGAGVVVLIIFLTRKLSLWSPRSHYAVLTELHNSPGVTKMIECSPYTLTVTVFRGFLGCSVFRRALFVCIPRDIDYQFGSCQVVSPLQFQPA